MSVMTEKSAHPIIDQMKRDKGSMRSLSFRARRCVKALIDAYEVVLRTNPDIKRDAAKAKVAAMRRNNEISVYGATSDDWDSACKCIDKMFARIYRPRKGAYDRGYVQRKNHR